MRLLKIILVLIFSLQLTSCTENYISDETKSFCGKLKINPTDLAWSKERQKIYVTDLSNRVLVMSPTSMRVERIIQTEYPNLSISSSLDGKSAYILSGNSRDNEILILDTESDDIIDSYSLGSGFADEITLSKNGLSLQIAWAKPGKVSFLNISTQNKLTLEKEISTPDNSLTYIGQSYIYTSINSHLNVYDKMTGEALLHLPKSPYISGLSLNPEGSILAILYGNFTGRNAAKVTLINTQDFTDFASMPLDGNPDDLLFSHDGQKLYVMGGAPAWQAGEEVTDQMKKLSEPHITIIDVPSYKIDSSTFVSGRIRNGILSHDDKFFYFITLQNIPDAKRFLVRMAVSILDVENKKVIGEIPIPLPANSQEDICR